MKHISVIGCGTMGNGIAQTFALFEFKVKLYDISLNNLDNAKKERQGSEVAPCPPKLVSFLALSAGVCTEASSSEQQGKRRSNNVIKMLVITQLGHALPGFVQPWTPPPNQPHPVNRKR